MLHAQKEKLKKRVRKNTPCASLWSCAHGILIEIWIQLAALRVQIAEALIISEKKNQFKKGKTKLIIHYLQMCECVFENITICPGSLDLFYIVTYQMKWVKTTWTYSSVCPRCTNQYTLGKYALVQKGCLNKNKSMLSFFFK